MGDVEKKQRSCLLDKLKKHDLIMIFKVGK